MTDLQPVRDLLKQLDDGLGCLPFVTQLAYRDATCHIRLGLGLKPAAIDREIITMWTAELTTLLQNMQSLQSLQPDGNRSFFERQN